MPVVPCPCLPDAPVELSSVQLQCAALQCPHIHKGPPPPSERRFFSGYWGYDTAPSGNVHVVAHLAARMFA